MAGWSLIVISILLTDISLITITSATSISNEPSRLNLIKDDDCLGIAMRPLPRFGKRGVPINQEIINRLKRSCIMSRRQSKSDPGQSSSLLGKFPTQSWLKQSGGGGGGVVGFGMDSDSMDSVVDPTTDLLSLNQIRPNSLYWRYLIEQLSEKRDKKILERILNRNIRQTNPTTTTTMDDNNLDSKIPFSPSTSTSSSLSSLPIPLTLKSSSLQQRKLFQLIQPFLMKMMNNGDGGSERISE